MMNQQLLDTAILAGELAEQVIVLNDRDQKHVDALEEARTEIGELRTFKSQAKSTQEQLIGLAFPYDPSKPTSSVSPIPTAQDCIGQVRRKLDQAKRDRESIERYQKTADALMVDRAAAASALREARDMLLNDQSSVMLQKALAERLTAVLVQITRPS